MNIFMVLSLIGGLALFLYGMQMMGDGLKKASGGKLEMILEKLTSNKLMAVLLGAGVTAIIQSSSATTVMVVGFVNSGIMSLSRAVGVIMGANVGTTVTAWILSMTEITGQSLFLQLLKPSSFSPILAIVGVAILVLGVGMLWGDWPAAYRRALYLLQRQQSRAQRYHYRHYRCRNPDVWYGDDVRSSGTSG